MRTKRCFMVAAMILMTLANNKAFSAIYEWEAPNERDHYMALRCFLPDEIKNVRAIILLVPGTNGDGRKYALDPDWQEFARRNQCVLIACFFKGGWGGLYYEPQHWCGALLLQGITEISRLTFHPELESAPLGFWGHSAGGMMNYNFACWKPERTFAFVVNKGSDYEAAATSAVRQIPSLWIAGAKDTDLRIGNITSLYAENRRKGAPWGLIVEPGVDHAVGRSKEIGMAFLEEALALSFDSNGKFKHIDPGTGWLADFQTKEISKNSTADFGPKTLTWLPGEKTADLWKAIMLGLPTSDKKGEQGSALPQPSIMSYKN